MEEKIIKSVAPLPYALMMGAITGIVYFIIAIIIALIWLPTLSSLSSISTLGLSGLIAGLGVLMVIVMPIIGFAAGFIIGLFFAVVYNFLSPRIGGIKVRFEEPKQAS
jgi:hypothetical protein